VTDLEAAAEAPAVPAPSWRRPAAFLAKALVAVVCLWYSLAQVSWGAFVRGLQGVGPGALVLAALCAIGNISLVGLRWSILLAACGLPRAPGPLARALLAGTFYNGIVPGGVAGEVVRALRYSSESGAPREGVFASVVLDRLLGVLGLVAIVLFNLGLGYRALRSLGLELVGAVTASAILAGAALLLFRPLMRRLGWLLRPFAAVHRAVRDVYGVVSAARGRYGLLVQALALAILGHGLVILNVYALARGLGATTALAHVFLIVPLIGLASSLPVSLNGLGVREVSFVLLFPRAGMDPAVALGTSLLFFGLTTALALGCGAAAIALRPRRGGRVSGA
jgi:hypothetical protein